MNIALAGENLIIALPSKGKLAESADNFLGRAGLQIYKPNNRQYTATIPSLPQSEVVYQRPRDILEKVAEGRADIGVTGLDIVRRTQRGLRRGDGDRQARLWQM